jgi:hypothetical protein
MRCWDLVTQAAVPGGHAILACAGLLFCTMVFLPSGQCTRSTGDGNSCKGFRLETDLRRRVDSRSKSLSLDPGERP